MVVLEATAGFTWWDGVDVAFGVFLAYAEWDIDLYSEAVKGAEVKVLAIWEGTEV